MLRLEKLYKEEVAPGLLTDLKCSNPMRVPKLVKVVVNMGVGEALNDKKRLSNAADELALITGQKPVICKARKSVASFKIREGFPIGCKVTLRSKKMYNFLDQLLSVALPRVRDFRGLSPKSFDGFGNYNMGVTEHIIFPEIDYEKTDFIKGLDIAVVTTARTDEEALALLRGFKFPFRGLNK